MILLILHLCPAQCTHTWLLQLLSAGELVLWRRARTALADEPGLRKTVCVCGGNVRVAEGIDSLPSSAPFLSLHPVVGDGSLKRGARDHLRGCVFVGFLCVNNFSFAVFAVSPPTWSHCKYFPYRLQQMMMLVIALPLHNDVDMELEGGRNRPWSLYVRYACRET